jgi:hypothetical protein
MLKNSQRKKYEEKYLKDFRKFYKLTAHKDVVKSTKFGIWGGRNLLFEHHGFKDRSEESLFEKILSTKGMSPLIHVIWDEFELWRKERVLRLVRNIFSNYKQSNLI